MSKVLRGYNKLCGFPWGKYIFSKIICRIAPYFKTIKPRFVDLKPGYCEVTMKNRKAVRNHLNSVHAIAMCNLCELVGGTALEVSLPDHLRWIPRGMQVEYLKIAKTDLRGTCTIPESTATRAGSLPVIVHVTDNNGTEVMRTTINMHVTERKK